MASKKVAFKSAALAKAVPREASKKRKNVGVPHDGVIHKLLKQHNAESGKANTIKPEAVMALSDIHAIIFERVMRQVAASHDTHKTLSARAIEAAWAIVLPPSPLHPDQRLLTHIVADAGNAYNNFVDSKKGVV